MDTPVDLLVGHRGVTHLLEIKAPNTAYKGTKKQIDFINNWKGSPVHVVRDAATAIDIVTR